MIKKCLGCGAIFQSSEPLKEGFIEEENYDKSVICKRCFRIKNYGEYSVVDKNKDDLERMKRRLSKSDNKDAMKKLYDLAKELLKK